MICPRGCGETLFIDSYGERICCQCARVVGEVTPSRAEQVIPDHNAAMHMERIQEDIPSAAEEALENSGPHQRRLSQQQRFHHARALGFGVLEASRQVDVSFTTGRRYEKEGKG